MSDVTVLSALRLRDWDEKSHAIKISAARCCVVSLFARTIFQVSFRNEVFSVE